MDRFPEIPAQDIGNPVDIAYQHGTVEAHLFPQLIDLVLGSISSQGISSGVDRNHLGDEEDQHRDDQHCQQHGAKAVQKKPKHVRLSSLGCGCGITSDSNNSVASSVSLEATDHTVQV